jgi:hypothetical protein
MRGLDPRINIRRKNKGLNGRATPGHEGEWVPVRGLRRSRRPAYSARWPMSRRQKPSGQSIASTAR